METFRVNYFPVELELHGHEKERGGDVFHTLDGEDRRKEDQRTNGRREGEREMGKFRRIAAIFRKFLKEDDKFVVVILIVLILHSFRDIWNARYERVRIRCGIYFSSSSFFYRVSIEAITIIADIRY